MSAVLPVDHCLADAIESGPRTEPMCPVAVVWQDPRTLDPDRLTALLRCFGDLLTQPLSARLDLADYAAKLLRHAEIACGVAAVVCAELGIRCHLVIVLEPDTPYLDSGNILLMRLSGATIEFCRKEQLAERMDAAMAALTRQGHHPLYGWGGGHGLQGTVAFVEAAAEAQAQCGEWRPDFMIAASATGSTQAGFAIGYAGSSTRVIGISVAREAERGTRIVRRAARAGVFVDPTYSGKALRGLVELVRRGDVPRGSRVLFWHTGGLMNLLASPLVGDAITL